MRPLRLPSRLSAAPTPLFGMCWYADPADGTSIIAACGGGGSSKTGVKNLLMVQFGLRDDMEPLIFETGDSVGTAVTIAKNPVTNKLTLFLGLDSNVLVYSLLPSESKVTLEQELDVGGGNINALATNAMVDSLAVGCGDEGAIKVYQINHDSDHRLDESAPQYECEGHDKTVCTIAFAPRSNLMVSSAKDGTARVWRRDACIAVLACSINPPNAPEQKRPVNVIVKGCGFGDLDGNLVYTVASGRRGSAYLAKWGPKDITGGNNSNKNSDYVCIERTPCLKHPASSMSIAGDAATIALASAGGDVTLWDTQKWKAVKTFPEVHDLPVTCISIRPFDVPLQGEEQSLVRYDAISASGDCQMGWLTRQWRVRKRPAGQVSAGFPLAKYVNSLVKIAVLYWIMSPLARDAWETCGGDDLPGISSKLQCVRDDILIAPLSRPGIAVPPH